MEELKWVVCLVICVGLFAMSVVALAIGWITHSYFNAVSRNPTIGNTVIGPLLALAGMAELAMLIMTAVVLYLMFKL